MPDALGGFATSQPSTLEVQFTPQAQQQLVGKQADYHRAVITEVLAQDPRPAYKKGKTDTKHYAVNLFDFNVQFTVTEPIISVISIDPLVQ